ncbi:MAG: four helix bundle protein [Lentisphaerales bacterium]|nr:MAG: four helix bundle protein [Lentisphaerales bacterium]
MKIERFEDIEGWQLARELCRQVYAAVQENAAFAKDWGLQDQITRAAGSAMDNPAEGFDAGSNAEFIRFLGYAQRSCSEVQSQLYRALDLNYMEPSRFDALYALTAKTKAKFGSFIAYLKKSNYKRA